MSRRWPHRRREFTPLTVLIQNVTRFRAIFTPFFKERNRYPDEMAPRAGSIEPPTLPMGIHHKLSANAYCTRDARRLVKPPVVSFTAVTGTKSLPSGLAAEEEMVQESKE
ncbi:NADH dehydrogenase [ubiquinone] 1 alpha subcomplex subunit 7-like [Lingula anatina]|uniref:NADH dehydrogenase [ubiquinone] 1 alpha subcomplex subunit 7 n=1 Tax=Lingula anatina TaxID=7574 RepID=A0A1S3IDF2_LINAN|nr:NADH dehydrogenase [ubiquinone] 1 alpha subcomplex subunit 7-like [Lingula anatina]|eukprot:XP_013396188.1 NADH dehydrogenase [ubiquinone] 1 alpha subcomplex subunit 7-like [Lingula anatina]